MSLPIALVPHPHVAMNTGVLGGSPYVTGSQVLVRRLWSFHQGGTSLSTLIKRYPRLSPGAILDALAFAYDNPEVIEADLAREEQMLSQGDLRAKRLRLGSQIALPFGKVGNGSG